MKTEQQYYEEAISVAEYMDSMTKMKDESFLIYRQFDLPNDDFFEQLKNQRNHWLAITEDWCGDAMLVIPVIRKIAEATGVEMRVAYRDADTNLIDRHLTNGGRAIPIILVLDEQGEVVAKWGPRAPEVQHLVAEARAELPNQDDPAFAEKQKAMYNEFKQKFISDPIYSTYVYESFKKTVLAIQN